MQGIFAIHKPKGPTSHDIINQIRKATGIKRIGHAGTLDPLASGVLVVAIGREFTKQINIIVKAEKEYITQIFFGEESTTDDAEGEKKKVKVNYKPTLEEVDRVINKFKGEIMQTPPIYSSIKIKGRPAHRRVRKGEKVELEPRKVLIKKIKVIKYNWPNLELKVVTGPGVYIRSLARDIGKRLGVGGYLAGLERIRVGIFTKSQALSVKEFSKSFS